ncbi:MAG: PQQ-like beta-propeller repeat protein [Verrucomicrobiales bacterium]|nr:PQQ-like beta-propeller repeat protein [Verrucomicrobiales bacterium]
MLITLLVTSCLEAETVADPAPPTVFEVPVTERGEPASFARLTGIAPPAPRPPEAVNADWPRFLGPMDNCISPETHLLSSFPEGGPAKVWEMEKGSGYTSPVIADGRLVFFDRRGDEETIDCLDPETGRRFWTFSYPVDYTDRYGFNNGPRASAILSDGKVYTLGVRSMLTCLDLASGSLIWQRNLKAEFHVADFFFGHGSCPLIFNGKVIVPLGTDSEDKGISVAAFDADTGILVWTTEHEWNASYASPIIAELRGEPRLLVFQGGESDPAFGGLLAINPETGELLDAFPWRPDKYESVNGSTPVAVGDDQVFLSSSYQHGAILLRLNDSLKWETVWKAPEFGLHWTTPLLLDGHLYGFRGRNEPDAWLASYSVATGKENWREDFEWNIPLESGRDYRMKYLRGSLLHADNRTYALGELGSLGIFNLTSEGAELLDRTQLFLARSTWSLPVLHRGLLYVSQHENDVDGNGPRLICYDLRAGSE